jgi:RNA polymerase sigma-70 factor (ECF subfamily)
MSHHLEDSELIINIKKGDSKSLELLFRRLYPRLCAYAKKFLMDSDDAEEIVQEVFYSLWKHRSRLDEDKSLNSYLFTSVKNSCLNHLNSLSNKTKHAELMRFLYVQEAADNVNSYHALLAKDLEQDFNAALEHLPSECRKIFELSRTEGLKYKEIAHKLNISIKTVETQMSRALSKLRLQLREHIALLIVMMMLK